MGVITQDSVDPHSAPQHSIVMQLVAVLGLLLAVGQTISQEQGGPPFLCPESNGFFPDPEQCDKYYECVGEIPEEKFCPDGLLFEASNPNNELCDYPFNVAQGTCVREEQASSFARKCEASAVKANIEGFECPEGETIGPNGIPLAHPSFPHPTSCRKYIVCEFSTTPKELGCTDGLVFDHVNNKCVNPEDGPEDCQCWYSCPDNSQCSESCNTDCSCP